METATKPVEADGTAPGGRQLSDAANSGGPDIAAVAFAALVDGAHPDDADDEPPAPAPAPNKHAATGTLNSFGR